MPPSLQGLLSPMTLVIGFRAHLANSGWAHLFLKIRNMYLFLLKYSFFPSGSDGKGSAWNEWGPSSIPGSGQSPGEENDNPLQYSCPENPMDRGAWWATVHAVAKNWAWLSNKPTQIAELAYSVVLGSGVQQRQQEWPSITDLKYL